MTDEPNVDGSRPPSRLVAVGASAGGVTPIRELVGALPPDIDAAILVVLHLSPTAHSALPAIIGRHTQLRVHSATDHETLCPGHVYVAPPDHHLLVEGDHCSVTRGPWENGHRPAIDPLFRSIAEWWGDHAVAVVLSGALDDGAASVGAVYDAGGLVIVQDLDEASVPDMPRAALETGAVHEVLRIGAIARRLVEVCGTTGSSPAPLPDERGRPAGEYVSADERRADEKRPSAFVCPDCGGTLFEMSPDGMRFRCRTGHAWSAESLRNAQHRKFEEALFFALRVLEEDVALQERLASHARAGNHRRTLDRIERRLAERRRVIAEVQRLIDEHGATADPTFVGDDDDAVQP
jgi:two-component system chemotaxis response regulator CheB